LPSLALGGGEGILFPLTIQRFEARISENPEAAGEGGLRSRFTKHRATRPLLAYRTV